MTDNNDHRNNRFERHPFLAWGILILMLLVGAELVLRLIDPEANRFAREFRYIYKYHDRWYTDFDPDTTTTFRLGKERSGYYLNFLVSINEHGFRWYDRRMDEPLPDPAANRIIHAVGDSFTMGWGVNYESSYPAQLQEHLPQGYAVLNLGLNGFGVVGATEKSLTLASEFPPAAVVYLATGNDYSDDEVAARYAAKHEFSHAFFDALNIIRRYIYLPNIWYAVRWQLCCSVRPPDQQWLDPRDVSISELNLEEVSNPAIGSASKSALLSFIHEMREREVPLIVIAHGSNTPAADIARFSAEQDVPSYLIDFPKALLLHREGHLNRVGNARMAEYVQHLLRINGIIK